MADGACQRIRRVVGARIVVEMQQAAHHIGNLMLIGRAGATTACLIWHGRVLATLMPASEHATNAAPRACAVGMAERTLAPK